MPGLFVPSFPDPVYSIPSKKINVEFGLNYLLSPCRGIKLRKIACCIWSRHPVRARYHENNYKVPYLRRRSSILRAGVDSAAAAPPATAERAASVAAPSPTETVAAAGAAAGAAAVAAAATVVAVAVSVRLRLAAGSGYWPGVREESLDYPLPLHPCLCTCKFY
jgi:hypothetical protein